MERRATKFDIASEDGTRYTVICVPFFAEKSGYGPTRDYVEIPSQATVMTTDGDEVIEYADGTFRVEGSTDCFRQITEAVPDDDED